MNDILLYFAWKYEGDAVKILNALEKKESVDFEEVQKVRKLNKDKFITLLDVEYPDCLKHVSNPPFVLFYRGDITLLKQKSLAFIGSRSNSNYGKVMVEKLIPPLIKKYAIVSGLAKGIDSLAHQCCLDNGGKCIAVLGNGLDSYYPYINKKLQKDIENRGLIISEYPSFVTPNPDYFPKRNRIIAGLSKGVVVIESKKKSGTMITVEYALSFGKEVFCVPSVATRESGCNYLIKNGAKLTENANDILEEL